MLFDSFKAPIYQIDTKLFAEFLNNFPKVLLLK